MLLMFLLLMTFRYLGFIIDDSFIDYKLLTVTLACQWLNHVITQCRGSMKPCSLFPCPFYFVYLRPYLFLNISKCRQWQKPKEFFFLLCLLGGKCVAKCKEA